MSAVPIEIGLTPSGSSLWLCVKATTKSAVSWDTHRNNIHRYRRLLLTELPDLERGFIDRRMAEEKAALDALVAETFPVTFPVVKDSSSTSSSVGAAS